MLERLLEVGISQAEIARQLNVSRAAITYACRNDKWSPAYDRGKQLEQLYKEQCHVSGNEYGNHP